MCQRGIQRSYNHLKNRICSTPSHPRHRSTSQRPASRSARISAAKIASISIAGFPRWSPAGRPANAPPSHARPKRPLHPIPRGSLEATVNAIRRRNLRREWRRNPAIPGATLTLSPSDEARVHAFVLRIAGVRIENLATPRATDRIKWAAALALSKRCTEATAPREIGRALNDERKWMAATL